MPISKFPSPLNKVRQEKYLTLATIDFNIAHKNGAFIPLVSVGGTRNLDCSIFGPLEETPILKELPLIRSFLSSLELPVARTLLVFCKAQTQFKSTKYNYNFFRHSLLCMPLLKSQWEYQSENICIKMDTESTYLVQNYKSYTFINKSDHDSYCLMVEINTKNFDPQKFTIPRELPKIQKKLAIWNFYFEIISTCEMQFLLQKILEELHSLKICKVKYSEIQKTLYYFQDEWDIVFRVFGYDIRGELAYRSLISLFKRKVIPVIKKWMIQSKVIKETIQLISSMLATSDFVTTKPLISKKLRPYLTENVVKHPKFAKPIIIIAAPRSGSTMLFETLAKFPTVWTIGKESHEVIESIAKLHPSACGYSSHCLDERNASPDVVKDLYSNIARNLRDNTDSFYTKQRSPKNIRFLEKTPKNVLRIPFINAVFPDCIFIFLYRDPCENISSLIEGWRSRKFDSRYGEITGTLYNEWSFFFPPNWRSLQKLSVAEIAAHQWKIANLRAIKDLSLLDRRRWTHISYKDLVENPKKTIQQIATFAELPWDSNIEQILSRPLPIARKNVSPPEKNKWKKHKHFIFPLFDSLQEVTDLLKKLDK